MRCGIPSLPSSFERFAGVTAAFTRRNGSRPGITARGVARITAAVLSSLLVLSSRAPAQPVERIINIYTPVVEIENCRIRVQSTKGFAVGDRVLLIQMQGATSVADEGEQMGTVTDIGASGNFELGAIAEINGDEVSLEKWPARPYDVQGKVQMIRVPVYHDFTISDRVTAPAWNGSTGGVVVLEATGTVTLTADGMIDVSGRGFRGGKAIEMEIGGNNTVGYGYPGGSLLGAEKGEGITIHDPAVRQGRGAWSNGGGGGNNHNAGGGGGALMGSGGFGGCEWSGSSDRNLATRGIGGRPAPTRRNPPLVYMGGGGGAGHTNNRTGTSGGNGGGIILIRAAALKGTGSLRSRGDTPPLTTGSGQDGCGGGGAAGSILLDVGEINGSWISVDLGGGNGGSTTFYEKVGPGGGGSGGLLWVSSSKVSSGLAPTFTGGTCGVHVNNEKDPWEATHGDDGRAFTDLVIPEGTPRTAARIVGNRKLCSGDTLLLEAEPTLPPGAYRWSTGDTTSSIRVAAEGTYWVRIGSSPGCGTADTVLVEMYPAPQPILPARIVLCREENIVLDAGGDYTSYRWSTGEGTRTITVSAAGVYSVVVTNASGCEGNAKTTVEVDNPSPVKLTLEGSPAGCIGDSVVLDVGEGYSTHEWSTGETTRTIVTRSSGAYWVRVTTPQGCVSVSDTVTTLFEEPPKPVVTGDIDPILCMGESITLSAGSGYASYRWSTGETTESIDVRSSGTYTVEVANVAGGCEGASAPFVVTVNTPTIPEITLEGNPVICDGKGVVLHATAGMKSYLWSTGETLDSITVTGTGYYNVTVIDSNGCTARSDTIGISIGSYPGANAGPDTSICRGGIAVLSASGGSKYRWSPAAGLSCPDCAVTDASPGTTTEYIVTVENDQGCAARDTVIVTIDPAPDLARFRIAAKTAVYPGARAVIPVLTDDPLDAARAGAFVFTTEYRTGMLQFHEATTAGTLTEGWNLTVLDQRPGRYSARLTPPPGGYLKGRGSVLNLTFNTFITNVMETDLPFTIVFDDLRCTGVETSPGRIVLDSMCGISFRLIEGMTSNYSLEPNRPNPFNPSTEITFSLGLDGPTKLTIHDVSGEQVAVLIDEFMSPGTYSTVWNAGEFPSGLYYCRLTSGAWSRTGVMMLVK